MLHYTRKKRLGEAEKTKDILTAEGLSARLNGRSVRCFPETVSTNPEARAWGLEGAPHGALVTADHQTGGHGRKGRAWHCPPGEGLMMSLILRPEALEGVQTLTLVGACATALAVEKTAGVPCRIKWPNDLWIGEKKVCGILTELVTPAGGRPFVVMGLGLNVHQTSFPREIAPTATSLVLEAETVPSREELAAAICREMDALTEAWQRDGFAAVAAVYRPRMALLGEWITLTDAGESRRMRLSGVRDDGALWGLDEDGREMCVISGEVTVRRE